MRIVRKGMTQNAKQGYNNGGTPPFGYRTEYVAVGSHKTKSVWVPGSREEVDIIRWIFNQYAYENKGSHKIVSELNERQVQTRKVAYGRQVRFVQSSTMSPILVLKFGTSRIIRQRERSGGTVQSGLLQRMHTQH